MPFKQAIDTERLSSVTGTALVESDSESSKSFSDPPLHLQELVATIRSRFSVPAEFSNQALLADLKEIERESDTRERWRAAFSSDLGQFLAANGCDLNTALNTLVALVPRKLS